MATKPARTKGTGKAGFHSSRRDRRANVKEASKILRRQEDRDTTMEGRFADIPIAPPRPVAPVVDKMCARCPFRPDGTGYARDHDDFPRIEAMTGHGMPFYCHETVILDDRTVMDKEGEGPAFTPQPHFKLCRGAREHHLKVWSEKARMFFKGHK
jgi:hypothetical protein